MTRHWLAAAAALAMMTGVALAQGASSESPIVPQPTAGSNSAGGVTSSTPPPAPASTTPTIPSVTNFGTGGVQALPGTSSNIGTGTR
jgi:hypothetical protein